MSAVAMNTAKAIIPQRQPANTITFSISVLSSVSIHYFTVLQTSPAQFFEELHLRHQQLARRVHDHRTVHARADHDVGFK